MRRLGHHEFTDVDSCRPFSQSRHSRASVPVSEGTVAVGGDFPLVSREGAVALQDISGLLEEALERSCASEEQDAVAAAPADRKRLQK